MRIIAGEFGGRRIDAPPGDGTRPMLDRVREALFATLHDCVDGQDVLDLFAGSGSLGLEALSRGARSARFVERGASALTTLKRNVEALGVSERARVVRADALKPTAWIEREGEALRYGLAFFDPPYPMLLDPHARPKLFAALQAFFEAHATQAARMVFHVPTASVDHVRLGPKIDIEAREYGTSTLLYLTVRH